MTMTLNMCLGTFKIAPNHRANLYNFFLELVQEKEILRSCAKLEIIFISRLGNSHFNSKNFYICMIHYCLLDKIDIANFRLKILTDTSVGWLAIP